MSDIVERLRGDAVQLRKMVQQASFAGDETGVRVKSPDLLLADLDEAVTVLDRLREALELAYSRLDPMAEAQETIDIIEAALAQEEGR